MNFYSEFFEEVEEGSVSWIHLIAIECLFMALSLIFSVACSKYLGITNSMSRILIGFLFGQVFFWSGLFLYVRTGELRDE